MLNLLWIIFISRSRANQNDCDGTDGYQVTDKWKDGFRAEVCFKPPGGYDGAVPWNVTLAFDIPIENFNANQAEVKVKNVTADDAVFVVQCYPQDCNLGMERPARFGFMGMFTQSMEDSNGEIVLPKTLVHWRKGTNESEVIYDSEAPITTTTTLPPDASLNSKNSTVTIYYDNGDGGVVEAERTNKTEKPKLPHGWVEPEPDYVKFALPFNSPHAAKFSALDFNYGEAIHKSILFYESQRSGVLPASNRIPWRGNAMMLDLGPLKENLSKGYFDAGDHVKFTFPMAFSMTLLSWGLLQYWETYESIGELDYAIEQVMWGADWLLKANPRPNVLFAVVGDPAVDHKYWGRAENFTDYRPTFKVTAGSPGTDVAAEVAAAMSAISLVLRRSGDESTYPAILVARAELLLQFADQNRRLYHQSVPVAAKHYRSSGYKDELCWAAAWLFRASGNFTYLNLAKQWYNEYGMGKAPLGMRFSWDDKRVGVQVLMSQIVGDGAKGGFIKDADEYCRDIQKPSKALYTPGGLVYLDEWGSIRYAMNSAFACIMVSDLSDDPHKARRYHKWSQSQIDYVLGAKNNGFSFMVGFGKKYPLRPHHRGASCPKDPKEICNYSFAESEERNPIVIWGAIVGGPDRHDGYKDERLLYKQSEVALDFNAGFQSTTAGVLHHILHGVSNDHFKVDPVFPTAATTAASNVSEVVEETASSSQSAFNFIYHMYIVILICSLM